MKNIKTVYAIFVTSLLIATTYAMQLPQDELQQALTCIEREELNQALIVAAWKGNKEQVVSLLKQGAQPDVLDRDARCHFSALHWAATNNNLELMKLFLSKSPINLNIRNPNNGQPPLVYATVGRYRNDKIPAQSSTGIQANNRYLRGSTRK